MKVLNSVVSWTEEGIELAADQRHAEIATELLGLKRANGVTSPG